MAIKKFLSESGFKHFVEKVIGKTDISSVGDGTLKGAVSSLNINMVEKLSKKQDASTAITTSNIGSQSVNYAKRAGSANSAKSVAWGGVSNKPDLLINSDGIGWLTKCASVHAGFDYTTNSDVFELVYADGDSTKFSYNRGHNKLWIARFNNDGSVISNVSVQLN